jgi:orotate phosphoribosyltransferase
MPLIGEAFLREFARAGAAPRSVGGLTSGADAIANAISYFSLSQGSSMNLFSVRKDRKEHGTERWIEGCGENPVAVVDDVATSGGSIIKAIERCHEEGHEIAYVGVLVDREEGGMEAIRKVVPDLPVTAIFTKSELDGLRAQESGQS